jgi:cytosine/uracil/thiamine/allantoin permease
MQVLFGEAFLATITSWVVGFVVGAIFAVLSYLFYIFAVAVISGALGYFAAVGIMLAIGLDPGFLVWLIGIIVGVVFIFVTFQFNLQKYAIIIATAFLGAGTTFATFILLFNPLARFLENPVKVALSQSWFLLVLFALMVATGIVVQYVQNKTYTLESYNNWETE